MSKLKKNTKPNLNNPSMCYKYHWTTSWVADLKILKALLANYNVSGQTC